MSRKIAVLIILLLLLSLTRSKKALAADPYWLGWYTDVKFSLADYKQSGVNLVLPVADTQNLLPTSSPTYQSYLDEAQRQGIKVIVPAYVTNGKTLEEHISFYKVHPALFGWYLADEPECSWSYVSPTLLKTEWYDKVKNTDLNHPSLTAFCATTGCPSYPASQRPYYNSLDIIMADDYEFKNGTPEFHNIGNIKNVVDTFVKEAKDNGKNGFIFVPQGFCGAGQWRCPTQPELRYSLYTAVVRDTLGTLFYADYLADNSTWTGVNSLIKEVSSLGEAVRNGTFMDPAISISGEGKSYFSYKYGSDASYHYLIVVNDAGFTLAPTFTLPADVSIDRVEVLNENRSLSVTNRAFTDSYTKYQVHLYKFPKPGPTVTPTPLLGDLNNDNHVNAADFSIFAAKYGTNDSACDFNHNGTVDAPDFDILKSNYGR